MEQNLNVYENSYRKEDYTIFLSAIFHAAQAIHMKLSIPD